MAYPSKLTEDAILAAATDLVDAGGVEALSLRTLAARLGVRAPSLYRYYPDKETLLRAVAARFVGELSDALSGCETLASLAGAYREYGVAYPRRYLTIFRNAPAAERPPEAVGRRALDPLIARARALGAGPPLPVARAIWSYLHGAVSLELEYGRQPRPGLDSAEAFMLGVRLLERGLSAQRDDAAGGRDALQGPEG